MIVVDESPGLLVITQTDHARLAGELLSVWTSDGLPDHPRREDLLFATREHDNGWREADSAPRVEAARQRPCDFISYPSRDRVEIWQRGIERFCGRRPYVALLIAHHAETLFRQDGDAAGTWRELAAALDDRRQEWTDSAAVGPAEIEADYRFLSTADLLSLAVCNRWHDPIQTDLVQAELSEGTLQLRPFPLAGATTFRVPCRRIPDRPYAGDADLGGELARARWSEISIRIVPDPTAVRMVPGGPCQGGKSA